MHKRQTIIDKYADAVFGYECIPRGQTFYGLIDPEEWTLEERDRLRKQSKKELNPKRLYVLHAPSNKGVEGSEWIVKQLEEMKSDGLPIELILVHGLTPAEAKKQYALADIAVDQISMGAFGLFVCEMMLWQIPVLVYQSRLFDKFMGDDPPVTKIWRDTFKSEILAALEKKRRGETLLLQHIRNWTLYNRAVNVKVGEMIQVYQDVMKKGRLDQIRNEQWFRQEKRMMEGVKSAFWKWAIENNAFPNVDHSQYDKELYL